MDKFVLNGEIIPDYENKDCMLFNYDCLEVLKELPNESIDLIVSDVPYHIVIGSRCSKKQGYPAKNQGKLFEYDSIKFEEYLPLIYDKMKNNSHCYLMINEKNLTKLQLEAEKVRV